MRAEISSAEVSLRETSGEIANMITVNQSVERDIDTCKCNITDQQEVRSRQQATIYQNHGALNKWEQEVFAQHSRINVLEKERATLIDRTVALDRKSTRLNSSHSQQSRMPSSA